MSSTAVGNALKAFAVATLFGAASIAHAGLVQVYYDGNDCAGVFTVGPGECEVNGSPLIAKFDTVDGGGYTTTLGKYPSITGSEFTIESTGQGTGTWSYNAGADDPAVNYWVAKGGPAFHLHYESSCSDGVYGSIADAELAGCGLDTATSQTSGAFYAPLNPNGNTHGGTKRYGLSHISFYNGGASVPEPATLGMLGAGLFALGLMRRRAVA